MRKYYLFSFLLCWIQASSADILIHAVRHGETEFNVQGRIQGQSDSNLTANGKVQIERLALAIKDLKFDQVYASPLGRTKMTARILLGDHPITFDSRLMERDYGIHSGKLKSEFSRDDRCIETDEQVIARLQSFLASLSVDLPSGSSVLLITHSGCIRALFSLAKGARSDEKGDHHFKVGNGSVVHFSLDKNLKMLGSLENVRSVS